jgi:hypothetical protein
VHHPSKKQLDVEKQFLVDKLQNENKELLAYLLPPEKVLVEVLLDGEILFDIETSNGNYSYDSACYRTSIGLSPKMRSIDNPKFYIKETRVNGWGSYSAYEWEFETYDELAKCWKSFKSYSELKRFEAPKKSRVFS